MKRRTWSLIIVLTAPVLALIFALGLVSPAYAIDYTVTVDCPTIQACINLAGPGDTVLVPAGLYTESLTLSSPISLTGASSVTTIIQALSGQRVLTVTGAAIDNTVIISGLTFRGGDVSGGNICFSGDPSNCGGGILLTDNAQPAIQYVIIENNNAYRGGGLYANETGGLLLDHIILRNNSAILSGGGLNARNMPVTVTNSLFQQNTTTHNVGGALVTGADFGIVAPVLISNTTFLGNTAQCLGGQFGICEAPAVYLFDQDAQIISSLFEGNNCTASKCDGGGVYMTASFNNPVLSLTNTDFISNTAGGTGGGVLTSVPVTVSGGRFERNSAGGRQTAFSEGGGGIRAQTLILTGTEFISNTSGEDGGAIHVGSNAVIQDAILTANQAVTNGAGIYVTLNLAMTNTQFISNTAGVNGGGAYVSFGDAQLNGGRFERNRANGPENNGGLLTAENGGGGLWVGGDLFLSDTEIISNVAETNGGGAHVRGGVTLTGARFVANQSLGDFFAIQGYGGGGLYAASSGGGLTLTSTDFISNQAAQMGGGVHAFGPAVLNGGLFQNNAAVAGSGGGIWAASDLAVTGAQFTGNVSNFAGGGAASNEAASVTGGYFFNNRASFGGGLRAVTATVTSTQFISNYAASSGGGLSAFDVVDISSSLFQANASDGSGGGLGASFDPVTVVGSRFLDNQAATNGGGLSSSGPVLITNSLVQGNSASGNGGGLVTSGVATLRGKSEISGNRAGGDGGGIWANSGLDGLDGRFENNSSRGSGGGFYGGLSIMRVNGTVFANNQAGADGGGAFAFDGRAVGEALFEGNQAGGAGGGLFLRRFVNITATRFLGNAAALGGGLAISRTNTGTLAQFVHNSLFARNTATTSGAGIYWNQPRPVNLIHNTIASPLTTKRAAVHIVAGTVNITNNIIANHETGIQAAGGAVTETYNLFSGNIANTSGAVGGGTGSLTGSPAFVNPAVDDYHLTNTSQAVDLGIDAGIDVDFEGDPRPGSGGFDAGFDENVFAPILSISKTAVPANDVPYRGEVTYSITVTNSGDGEATGLLLTDTLPAEVTFARWLQQNGAVESGGQLTWSGSVAASEAITFSFVASHTGDYGDVLTNTVEFDHPESGGAGAAAAVVTVEPEPVAAYVYLPLIIKELNTAPPDLIVDSLVASSNAVTVVVKNVGAGPVLNAFWVDVYLDPDPPPTRVNQHWHDLGDQGIVWDVNLVPFNPGATLTLTIGDAYYSGPPTSVFTLPLTVGLPVYAQVDSVNLLTNYGGVLESHEINNGVYNNIAATTVVPAGPAAVRPAGSSRTRPAGPASPPRLLHNGQTTK